MGLPFLLTVLIAIAAAAVIGVLVGFVSLRVAGIYLAIATLCVSEILRKTFEELDQFTGGFSGLTAGYPTLFGFKLSREATFVLLTAAITWLVRFMTGAFGSVVNATPLIGSLSRGLGALLELLIYIMVLYFIYVWFLPWLVGLLPDLAVVNTIFTSSQVVLGIILDIGSLIWYSALTVI